jgi:hypothetical protein
MKRRLLSLAATASMVLCIMTAAIWVGSFAIPNTNRHRGVGFCWLKIAEGNDYLVLPHGRLEEWINTPWDGKWYPETSAPLWVPAALFLATAAALRVVAKKTPASYRPGQCPSCAYDLTGNRSGVCPECGSATRAAEAKA